MQPKFPSYEKARSALKTNSWRMSQGDFVPDNGDVEAILRNRTAISTDSFDHLEFVQARETNWGKISDQIRTRKSNKFKQIRLVT